MKSCIDNLKLGDQVIYRPLGNSYVLNKEIFLGRSNKLIRLKALGGPIRDIYLDEIKIFNIIKHNKVK